MTVYKMSFSAIIGDYFINKKLLLSLGIATLLGLRFWRCTREEKININNHRVLVTGAASGLGKATALAYAKHCVRLVITDINGDALQDVAVQCEVLGAKQVVAVTADLTVATDRDRLKDATSNLFDGGLDHLLLIHAARARMALWTASPTDFDCLKIALETNFISYVELAASFKEMLEISEGRIGIASSLCGKISAAYLSSYSVSKHALQAFFMAWSRELERSQSNISITLCVLGSIGTESTLRRINNGRLKLNIKDAVSPEDTANEMIRGVTLRKTTIFYPPHIRFVVPYHHFFPKVIEKVMDDRICLLPNQN